MAKFDDYTQKNTPEDNDITLILDKTANVNKKTPFSGIWTWIVNKMTNAVIQNLQTSNKTMIGAINELNSNMGGIPVDDANNVSSRVNTLVIFRVKIETLNTPIDAHGYILQMVIDSKNYIIQVCFPLITQGRLYIRIKQSGEWKDWHQIGQ